MRFSEAMDSTRKREPGKFIEVAAGGQGGFGGEIGFAGLVVEERDFRAGVVDDDEVLQTVAVEIGGVELADLLVEREDFRTGETEARAFVFSGSEGIGRKEDRGEKQGEGGAEEEVWHVVAGLEKRAETASGPQGWRVYSPGT